MTASGSEQSEEDLLREIGLHLQNTERAEDASPGTVISIRRFLIQLDEDRSDKTSADEGGQEELFGEESRESRRESSDGFAEYTEQEVYCLTFPDPVGNARAFLSARYEQIHGVLCGDSEKRKTLFASDEATAVALIADILPGLAIGVPVITLATLLARIGLKRICEGNPFRAE